MATLDEMKTTYNKTLYECVNMLILVYPLKGHTKQLLKYLKNDMFVKNNSAAFQILIYYLLQTQDSNGMGKKITIWPLLNVKDEHKFRYQILEYIDILHKDFPEHVPKVLASNLITPGGFKFVRFICKIAVFTLLQSLLKISRNNTMFLQFKVGSLTAVHSNKIIRKKRSMLNKNIESIIASYKNEANTLSNEIKEILITNKALENELRVLEENIKDEPINYPTFEEIFESSNLKEIQKYNNCLYFNLTTIKMDNQSKSIEKAGRTSLSIINELLEKFVSFLQEQILSHSKKHISQNLATQTCEDLVNFENQFQNISRDIISLEENIKKIFTQSKSL